MVPVVVLPHTMAARLAATWQFNKARGSHSVDLDAELIRALLEQGLTDDEVSTRLGVDLDTVHRYKQVTGIAALFARSSYSLAWRMVDEAQEK
jgi:ParB-like chromosome segregation protein Spo0J